MTLRALFVGAMSLLVFGCSEGTKPEPLPRAGVAAPAVPLANKKEPAKSLYERLGREEGLTQTVHQLVKDLDAEAKTKAMAGVLKKRALIDFLMEVSSKPRPHLADDLMLTPDDWSLLIPALRATLTAQGTPPADRDELLANIKNSR
jgi:hypothetical protein